jgi:hypothetical protein
MAEIRKRHPQLLETTIRHLANAWSYLAIFRS